MKTSEILFTRQHHLADRAGDHYDIRLVIGNKAHSFATRKDIPEPGKSIMLYETSIHTKDYALRKRIVIPKGNYGSGTTTLDFVRKANLVKNEEKGHFIMETTKGERFLLKPISLQGQKSWLFKNLGEAKKDLEKEAKVKKQKLFSRAVDLYKTKPKKKKEKIMKKTTNKYLQKIASDLSIAQKSKQEEDKAIVDYAARKEQTSNPELKDAITHARNEEKDHSSRFGKVIEKLKHE